MTKIDLNRVWDDAKAMGMANKDLLAAIAGMFVLLPVVVVFHFMKAPDGKLGAHPNQEAVAALYRTFFEANWPLFLGWTVLSCFGSLAMLVLLLRHERPTVAESLKGAIFILPSFLVAYFLRNIAMEVGLILILPACYLIGRFILIGAVAAAEQEYNPITIIQRSFFLTRGNGWRLFFLFFILSVVTAIVLIVMAALVGLMGALLLPTDLAVLVNSIVVGLIIAGFEATAALLCAAIYRAATAPSPTPWLPGAGG